MAQLGSTKIFGDLQVTGQATLDRPKISTGIFDINGNEVLNIVPTAAAVNELSIKNAATGGDVLLTTAGTDANINLLIQTKGTGAITLDTGTGAGSINLKSGTDSVRFWDDDSSHYYQFLTGNRTANYSITLPAASGTMLVSQTTPVNGFFDTSVNLPTGSTRLNYNGYLYTTYLNLAGSGDTATAATHYYVETGSDGFVRPKTLANVKTEIVTNAAVNAALATTVGTITSGVWNGTAIPVANGGTGATTAAAALTNLGLTATAAELNYTGGVTSNIQTQLNAKAASSHTHTIANVTGLQTALDGKVDDSQVLTNVPAGAVFTDTVYTHPTTAGNKHIPTGGASGQVLKYSASGTAVWGTDNDTIYTHPASHPASIITQDASNRFVTDAEKTTWNNKANGTHTHAIADTTGLQTALDGKSATTHNHTLDALSNTTITSNTSGEILKWNGTAWINNTLAEAGIQPAGSYLTGNQTITLSGDVSGSGTTAITVTVADDSHNHIISNVDGLQTALDAKAPLASPTFTGTPTISGSGRVISNDTATGTAVYEIWSGTQAQYDAIGTKDANTLYFIV